MVAVIPPRLVVEVALRAAGRLPTRIGPCCRSEAADASAARCCRPVMRPCVPPGHRMSLNLCTTGIRLVDSTELKNLGIVNSRTSLHRYLHREPDQNPFPQPLRYTVTGRRYWRESDVALWKEREDRRRCISLDDPRLVPDTDPRAWMPKGACRLDAASSATTGPKSVVSGPGIG